MEDGSRLAPTSAPVGSTALPLPVTPSHDRPLRQSYSADMPTGRLHYVIDRAKGAGSQWDEECRCIIGHDHTPDGFKVFESDLERWDWEEGRTRSAEWSGDD